MTVVISAVEKQFYFCLNIIVIQIYRVFSNEIVKSNHNEDIYLMSEEAIFFYFSSSLILFGDGLV